MDLLELKREQQKLAQKIVLNDGFTKAKTIGAAYCYPVKDKLLAAVIVCDSSMKLIESKTYLLSDLLPYHSDFQAYREMPAMIEAFNKLENEPDILIVNGPGILHTRKIGIASHLGLVLNVPTIGISQKLPIGIVQKGNIFIGKDMLGFEIKTREHSNSIYASPGHLISLGSVLRLIPSMIKYPHKLPEPLHLAIKMAKNDGKKIN